MARTSIPAPSVAGASGGQGASQSVCRSSPFFFPFLVHRPPGAPVPGPPVRPAPPPRGPASAGTRLALACGRRAGAMGGRTGTGAGMGFRSIVRRLGMGLGLVGLAATAQAEAIDLSDPTPRWIVVAFEVSPPESPGRLDADWSEPPTRLSRARRRRGPRPHPDPRRRRRGSAPIDGDGHRPRQLQRVRLDPRAQHRPCPRRRAHGPGPRAPAPRTLQHRPRGRHPRRDDDPGPGRVPLGQGGPRHRDPRLLLAGRAARRLRLRRGPPARSGPGLRQRPSAGSRPRPR
jgi:hypothetical protein